MSPGHAEVAWASPLIFLGFSKQCLLSIIHHHCNYHYHYHYTITITTTMNINVSITINITITIAISVVSQGLVAIFHAVCLTSRGLHQPLPP